MQGPVDKELSNVDRLLKARSEIDEELRRHKSQLTILFTDIVGSTSYFDRYGDTAGFAMVQRHAGIATKTFQEYQGTIIKMIGDSVMAEFPEPALAVRGSVELQRRLAMQNRQLAERDRILLRIGINTGHGFRHDNDVYGDAVNMAARICKKTGPAQILISRSVRDAIAKEADVRCTWLGKVTLSGKAEPEDIFEVVWTDTAVYQELRQNATAAFVRGDIVSPGLSPEELLQVKRDSAAGLTPPPAAPAEAPQLTPLPGGDSRYELMEELGRGGMGLVYKARDRDTGELVALKLLKPEIANEPTVFDRFKNELRIARRITHKSVCRIYDLHRMGNSVCIAMEFVEGDSLRQVLERNGRLDLVRGLRVVRQISSGLQEAHEQGVVHRDLKPENIMLDRTGNVKLMDFGIARTDGAGLTFTGGIIGTPAYMSPEQAEGRPVDLRTDIYALGLVMYEIFTGRTAFHGDTPIAIALKQIRETPALPRTHLPELPQFLEAAIMKCLHKDVAERFQSLEELDAALAAAGATGAAATPARAVPSPVPAAPSGPAGSAAETAGGARQAAATATPPAALQAPLATPAAAEPRAQTPSAATPAPAHTQPTPAQQPAATIALPRPGISARKVALVAGVILLLVLAASVSLLRQRGSEPAAETEIASSEVAPAEVPAAEPEAPPSAAADAEPATTAAEPPRAAAPAPVRETPPARVPAAPAKAVRAEPAAAAPAEPAAVQRPDPVVTALANAEAALAAGRVLEPGNDNALFWAQEAERLQPANPRARTLQQQIAQNLLGRFEVERRSRNYDAALAILADLKRYFPGRGDLSILEQSLHKEMQQQGAPAGYGAAAAASGITQRFNFSHRHPSMAAKDWVAENFYCSGVLTVVPDGSARFACTGTQDPQKRCHNVALPPGSITQVTFNSDGSLRLNTRGQGQWDFYGERTSLQAAYAALTRGARR